MENPRVGIVDARRHDFERILEICMPYLGNVVGASATGRRSTIADHPSPRTSTAPIPGSSEISRT